MIALPDTLKLEEIVSFLRGACAQPEVQVLLDGQAVYPREVWFDAEGNLRIDTLSKPEIERRAFLNSQRTISAEVARDEEAVPVGASMAAQGAH